MKLFISMPMRNKKPEEIEASMERYHEFCEIAIWGGKKLQLIKSYLPERKFKNPVEALSESLRLMSEADFVFFAPGWEEARGCKIEKAVCEAYGTKWADGNFWQEYIEKNMEGTTLRECPHCGADGGFLARKTETSIEGGKSIHYVMCCNCGARSGRTGDKASADAEWNRRMSDDSSDAASLPAVDVRMEKPDFPSVSHALSSPDKGRQGFGGNTEGDKSHGDDTESFSYSEHKEYLLEILEHLSKEILSRVKKGAADEGAVQLIHAHREIMESLQWCEYNS